MNQKVLGTSIIITGMLTLLVVQLHNNAENFLINKLVELNNNSCILENGYCLHTDRDLNKYYLGLLTSMLQIAIGGAALYDYYKPKKEEFSTPKNLGEEEQKVFEILKENEGSALQSELVKKTGYSKVKITRLLDKLENKKVLERKRRGMANLIVLK